MSKNKNFYFFEGFYFETNIFVGEFNAMYNVGFISDISNT